MNKVILNLLLFQIGWLVCVLGGDVHALGFTIFALLIHNWLIVTSPAEWKLITVAASIGCLWDMLMVAGGVIHYADALVLGIPLWLVCLWILFATTFMHSLLWLQRYLWLAVMFAALLGPLSYWFGSSLTAAELRLPVMTSLLIMAAGWGLLFPCGIYYAGKLKS